MNNVDQFIDNQIIMMQYCVCVCLTPELVNSMKQAFDRLRNNWAKFIHVLFPERKENQPYDELPEGVGRLYYSVPGKTFTGYIYKGRILTSGQHMVWKPGTN